ncbi:MAG TPA: LAGLIDADG family homing endonuclease [bacterium]|nr:LAGLIDADG family homing endonuclease [bacterium]
MTWNYVAGFFDGEGSITKNGSGFRITIVQTNKEVLEEIKKFIQLGGCYGNYKKKTTLERLLGLLYSQPKRCSYFF